MRYPKFMVFVLILGNIWVLRKLISQEEHKPGDVRRLGTKETEETRRRLLPAIQSC
jgi:flagellar biogenesis protein FliO